MRIALHVIVMAAVALATAQAHAAVACEGAVDSPPGPYVYVISGDTQVNLLKRLARRLADNTARPITLVFATTGSCAIIKQMYTRSPATLAGNTKNPVQYVPSTQVQPNWTPKDEYDCVPPADKFPDIGISALTTTACPEGQYGPPSTVALTTGPRQAYVMAVQRGSSQVAITYEEAYFIFGFGPTILEAMGGAIAPWLIETELQIRPTSKSTLVAWAKNIGVDPTKWHGTGKDGKDGLPINDSSDQVVSRLIASTNTEATLGILGAEVYDNLRDKLSSLAFRANGQYAAYYPDSTATSRDKKNVRDGHYTVWSPTVYMDTVGSDGKPINTNARYIIDLIADRPVAETPNFAPNNEIANVGLVPECAMRVTRDVEGGPLSLFKPNRSCTCEYESYVDTTTCKTCSETTPCATGVCSNGFCEEF